MSDSRDKKPDPPDAGDASAEKRSGRVAFDSRGNSVWEWQVQTGVYSRDVNTESVRKLDLDELSLEDSAVRKLEAEAAPPEQKVPRPKAPVAPPSPAPKIDAKVASGGFNPYDNANAFNKRNEVRDPYNNARLRAEALNADKASTPPLEPTRAHHAAARKTVAVMKSVPTDVRKLSGWLKLKQALLGKRSKD